jgi:DNA-binding NarL/FixJ family response regulator
VIRVLVADDHAGFRRGLTTLLGVLPDIDVVGEAGGGDEAVVRALATQPDVVLMDLDMPGGGLAATTRLAQEAPHVAVLVLTMSTDDDAVLAALRAGARGYLVKGAPRAELERALRTAADGGLVVGAAVAHRFAAMMAPAIEEPWTELESLSRRERDVLDLMAAGLDNAAIARRLALSPKTVRNTVSSVFTKLRTSDRVEVVLRAREAGLGQQVPGSAGHESLPAGTPRRRQ